VKMVTGLMCGALLFLLIMVTAFAVDPFKPFDFTAVCTVMGVCLFVGGFWGWAVA